MRAMMMLFLVLVMAMPAMAERRSFSGGYSSAAVRSRGAKSQGLKVGEGAMTPMEARLEQLRGNKEAKSERINNAQKAARKIKSTIPDAEQMPDREKVQYVKVSKRCCCEKQTVTASCCTKVGISKTVAEAKGKARPKATSKAKLGARRLK